MGYKRLFTWMITIMTTAVMLNCAIPASTAIAWIERLPATTSDSYHTWTVIFEEPMDMSTINNQNIFVSFDALGTSRVEGVVVSYSDSTHALVGPPLGGWRVGSPLYLIVSPDVLTAEGSSPSDAIRMQFTVQASSGIMVYLDGELLDFTIQPQTINERLMVPLRPIFEAMGAILKWETSSQTATAVKGSNTVVTQIGNTTAYINGEAGTLDVPPIAISGSTLAPLRFVAEAFGYTVRWDSHSQTAFVSSPGPLPSGTRLAADYWIPDDLGKCYIYACDDRTFGSHSEIVNWGQNADGSYVRVTELGIASAGQNDDSLAAEVYQVANDSVNRISRSGSPEQSVSWVEDVKTGQCSVIQPVNPGGSWSNRYSVSFNGGPAQDSPEETMTFVGIEDMTVLGSTVPIAHISCSYHTIYDSVTIDYWLQKGIGLVKMTKESREVSNGNTSLETMSLITVE